MQRSVTKAAERYTTVWYVQRSVNKAAEPYAMDEHETILNSYQAQKYGGVRRYAKVTKQGYTPGLWGRGRQAGRTDRLLAHGAKRLRGRITRKEGGQKKAVMFVRAVSISYDMWKVLWQNELGLRIESLARGSKLISKSGWRWIRRLMASLRRLQNHVPINQDHHQAGVGACRQSCQILHFSKFVLERTLGHLLQELRLALGEPDRCRSWSRPKSKLGLSSSSRERIKGIFPEESLTGLVDWRLC